MVVQVRTQHSLAVVVVVVVPAEATVGATVELEAETPAMQG